MNLETFLTLLLTVSVFTGLFTQAVKKILDEWHIKYMSNTLAGIIAILISIGVDFAYIKINEITPDNAYMVCLLALIFLSWLCSMVGYDKVVQVITQRKNIMYEKK